jgi:hypothetical protein
MSIEAPPPVLPIRDARIEPSAALLCHEHPLLLGVGHQVQRGATVVDAGTIESWIKTDHSFGAARDAARTPPDASGGLANAPGYAVGVFRPPRTAQR